MNSLLKVTKTEIVLFFRDKTTVFWTFLFPVIMIWLFGSMFGDQKINGLSYSSVYIPSWIAVNIMTVSFFTLGTVLANYREKGILRRYQLTPIKPWKILAAHTIQGAVIFGISAIVIFLFGYFFYDLQLPAYIGSTFGALLLSLICFFPFGLLMTSLAKDTKSAAAISSLLLNLMLFLSGATFPLEVMPQVLQYVAKILPLYYVVELLRATWNTSPLWDNGVDVLVLFLIGVASIFLSTKFFRWSGQKV
ncbi:ABC transporter permease [Pseudalkalibacillus caeni]|uniref:Transport permease protein n=1 Tax=Exobacillus caeni TaxID=2574798 RepID=A0A5R9F1B5_9BACL|nr:ABC transporter permease [Pseudalkalibacillus caeni]TLS36226.1 ABC transporter permease [Pseudalkalibacillus caeni]